MEKLKKYITQVRGITYKKNEISKKKTEGFVPILKANNITADGLNDENLIYISRKKVKDTQLIKKGDILLAASSGSKRVIGKNVSFKEDYPGSFGAFCKVVRPKNISPFYLKHFFKSPIYRQNIKSNVQGANINNLKTRDLDDLKLLVPKSLNQQKCIAQVLDDCETLIAQRKESIALLDELVRSIFLGLFGDPQVNPKGFKKKPLNKVVDFLTGYPFKSKGYVEVGIRICGGLIITPNFIDWESAKKWSKNGIENLDKYFLNKDDIVVAMDRPWISTGFKIGKIKSEDIPSLLIQRTARLRAIHIDQEFLYHSLKSRSFEFHCKPTETTVPHISPNDFYTYNLLIPPPKLQDQFKVIVKKIEQTKELYKNHLAELENLYGRLSQDAFKGKLDLSGVVLRGNEYSAEEDFALAAEPESVYQKRE